MMKNHLNKKIKLYGIGEIEYDVSFDLDESDFKDIGLNADKINSYNECLEVLQSLKYGRKCSFFSKGIIQIFAFINNILEKKVETSIFCLNSLSYNDDNYIFLSKILKNHLKKKNILLEESNLILPSPVKIEINLKGKRHKYYLKYKHNSNNADEVSIPNLDNLNEVITELEKKAWLIEKKHNSEVRQSHINESLFLSNIMNQKQFDPLNNLENNIKDFEYFIVDLSNVLNRKMYNSEKKLSNCYLFEIIRKISSQGNKNMIMIVPSYQDINIDNLQLIIDLVNLAFTTIYEKNAAYKISILLGYKFNINDVLFIKNLASIKELNRHSSQEKKISIFLQQNSVSVLFFDYIKNNYQFFNREIISEEIDSSADNKKTIWMIFVAGFLTNYLFSFNIEKSIETGLESSKYCNEFLKFTENLNDNDRIPVSKDFFNSKSLPKTKKNEFFLDCLNINDSKLKKYNALKDRNLGNFFQNPIIIKDLRKSGVLDNGKSYSNLKEKLIHKKFNVNPTFSNIIPDEFKSRNVHDNIGRSVSQIDTFNKYLPPVKVAKILTTSKSKEFEQKSISCFLTDKLCKMDLLKVKKIEIENKMKLLSKKITFPERASPKIEVKKTLEKDNKFNITNNLKTFFTEKKTFNKTNKDDQLKIDKEEIIESSRINFFSESNCDELLNNSGIYIPKNLDKYKEAEDENIKKEEERDFIRKRELEKLLKDKRMKEVSNGILKI
jgi:hypothetical protein